MHPEMGYNCSEYQCAVQSRLANSVISLDGWDICAHNDKRLCVIAVNLQEWTSRVILGVLGLPEAQLESR